ncbi:hypothetical protein B0H14DRAFT_2983124 [Mycena olivaceomarginata]|nr:hypothetical protein B0H14DRAFT_2983124 [Mycena olivaceomarginata]
MRTWGVVHAYVGVFPSLLSLPPRLRDELPQKKSKKNEIDHGLVSYLRVQTTDFIRHRTLPRAAQGHIHRYQVRSGSLPCFTDLVRCEPLRSGGALWSTGRAGAYLYLTFRVVAALPFLAFFE